MWCWHRIRSEAGENEKGLCPACRTPYGDDPHEFSALDLEDVIKANKEKVAAEKREKERRIQEQGAASAAGLVMSEHHFPSLGDYGSHSVASGSMTLLQQTAQQESSNSIPTIVVNNNLSHNRSSSSHSHHHHDSLKDRSSLANMRVIRRNLVYAVGLPPSVANEDLLKKSDYFGQYGKISKIVLNRSNISGASATNSDGNSNRRSSASAYVTFAHKEDTLACILALDGFYLDNRNIRASYGTSKYCSAFIKSVRCNNPDCTYLHVLGENEDTFTKQEIQAGYVTSGRDVLAKQQQQLVSLTGGTSGKRKVGGGGPSATGKTSAHPVFPPPTFDEPEKPQTRSRITGLTRSSSLPISHAPASEGSSVSSASSEANDIKPAVRTITAASMVASSSGPSQPLEANDIKHAVRTITAASIVASSSGPLQPKPMQNSKPMLTPLKSVTRSVSLPVTSAKPAEVLASKVKANTSTNIGSANAGSPSGITGSTVSSADALNELHNPSFTFSNLNDSNGNSLLNTIITSSQSSETGLSISVANVHNPSPSFGSEVSGLSLNLPFDAPIGSISASNADGNQSDQNKQWKITPVPAVENNFSSGTLGRNDENNNSIWGAVGAPAIANSPWAHGPPQSGPILFSSNAVIGSLNSHQQMPAQGNQSPMINNNTFTNGGMLNSSNVGLWDNGTGLADSTVSITHGGLPNSSLLNPSNSGKEIVGLGRNNVDNRNGSSALASMLGISLPTGSGSLREISSSGGLPSSDPFNFSLPSLKQPSGHMQSQVPSLWNDHYAQPLQNSALRANTPMPHGAIGSLGGNMGSDVAILQNLLPGVQNTSNDANQPVHSTWGSSSAWSSGVSSQNGQIQGQSNEKKNDPWGNGGGLFDNNQSQPAQSSKGIW